MNSIAFIIAFSVIFVGPSRGEDQFLDSNVQAPPLIVIGTLHRSFRLPWLDGWHEHGYIVVVEALKGNARHSQEIPLRWERDFWHSGWCLWRPDWTGAVGVPGIWLLQGDGKGTWWTASLFNGFLPLDERYEVMRLVRKSAVPAAKPAVSR